MSSAGGSDKKGSIPGHLGCAHLPPISHTARGRIPHSVSLQEVLGYLLCSGPPGGSAALVATHTVQGDNVGNRTARYSLDTNPRGCRSRFERPPLRSQGLPLWVLEPRDDQGSLRQGARRPGLDGLQAIGVAATSQLVMPHFHVHGSSTTCKCCPPALRQARCDPCSQGAHSPG